MFSGQWVFITEHIFSGHFGFVTYLCALRAVGVCFLHPWSQGNMDFFIYLFVLRAVLVCSLPMCYQDSMGLLLISVFKWLYGFGTYLCDLRVVGACVLSDNAEFSAELE